MTIRTAPTTDGAAPLVLRPMAQGAK